MTTGVVMWVLYLFGWLVEIAILSISIGSFLRKSIFGIVIFVVGITSGLVAASLPIFWLVLLLLLTLYRVVNLLRVPFERMHEKYLYNVVRRSSFSILAIHITLLLLCAVSLRLPYVLAHTHTILYVLSSTVITIGLLSLLVSIRRSRPKESYSLLGMSELPSLTVAIPARNETQDLTECLQSFCASRYEKLEIIVFDDCSHDKTSDIIKSFAHKGVRFIQGSEPGEVWLPKNAAYDKLANEANGDLLLFCGVDVRVEPDTLLHIVSYMKTTNVAMVSFLPKRAIHSGTQSVVQLVRYMWELCLPRQLSKRPAVLSTLWAIHKDTYAKLGGMESVKRMVVPESYFARELHKKHQYAFLRANNDIAITSTKSAKEQRNTALRVRYPQLHKRPEAVLLLVMCELVILCVPILAIVNYIQTQYVIYAILFLYLFVIPISTMIILVWSVTPTKRLWYLMQSIVAIPLDIFLVNYSMYKYEFGDVAWKERNVCLPVMHVVPSLPKID